MRKKDIIVLGMFMRPFFHWYTSNRKLRCLIAYKYYVDPNTLDNVSDRSRSPRESLNSPHNIFNSWILSRYYINNTMTTFEQASILYFIHDYTNPTYAKNTYLNSLYCFTTLPHCLVDILKFTNVVSILF